MLGLLHLQSDRLGIVVIDQSKQQLEVLRVPAMELQQRVLVLVLAVLD